MCIFDKCEEKVNFKKILLEEKKAKIVFKNKNKNVVRKIKIDDCVITDTATKRCDYLVIPTNTNIEHYVELKGSDLSHAVKQLTSAIKKISTICKQSKKLEKACYVIFANKCPLTTSAIQKHKINFKKIYNSKFFTIRTKSEIDFFIP